MADMHDAQRETITLYRPVGEQELALIEASGFQAFPPRLEWQPIFYPVTTEQYAATISRAWNARDGQRGFVTRFAVEAQYLRSSTRISLARTNTRNTGYPPNGSTSSTRTSSVPSRSSPPLHHDYIMTSASSSSHRELPQRVKTVLLVRRRMR